MTTLMAECGLRFTHQSLLMLTLVNVKDYRTWNIELCSVSYISKAIYWNNV